MSHHRSRDFRHSNNLGAPDSSVLAQTQQQQHHETCLDQPSDLLVILGLLIEALLFGMFTSCMMFDQTEVVKTRMTHIDRLKGAVIGGNLEGFAEVFGVGKRGTTDSRFRPDWLSPVHRVCFPESLKDELMGFCRPILCGQADDVEMATTGTRKITSMAKSPASGALRSIAEIV
jgi:hypothetical protein